MKRTKLIAGNWKMNKSLVQGMELVNEIAGTVASEVPSGVDVAVAPPFVHVHAVAQWLKAYPGIWTGAQDCSAHDSGAYTGEVSAGDGCFMRGAKLVLIGHFGASFGVPWRGGGPVGAQNRSGFSQWLDAPLLLVAGKHWQKGKQGILNPSLPGRFQELVFHLNAEQSGKNRHRIRACLGHRYRCNS
jgi:hypothetical protein